MLTFKVLTTLGFFLTVNADDRYSAIQEVVASGYHVVAIHTI